MTDSLPNVALVLHSFVRKEAVLSSMSEVTQSSLVDLMLFELDEQPGVPVQDAREVSRYVAALEHGLERLRGGFPLSLRLISEVHGVLLGQGRGARLTPGGVPPKPGRHGALVGTPRPEWRAGGFFCNDAVVRGVVLQS